MDNKWSITKSSLPQSMLKGGACLLTKETIKGQENSMMFSNKKEFMEAFKAMLTYLHKEHSEEGFRMFFNKLLRNDCLIADLSLDEDLARQIWAEINREE